MAKKKARFRKPFMEGWSVEISLSRYVVQKPGDETEREYDLRHYLGGLSESDARDVYGKANTQITRKAETMRPLTKREIGKRERGQG